jgi:hypothetical protein
VEEDRFAAEKVDTPEAILSLGDAHAAKVRIATLQRDDGGHGADATGAEELPRG